MGNKTTSIPVTIGAKLYYSASNTPYIMIQSGEVYVTPEEKVYINGVHTGFNGTEYGNKAENNKYSDHFIDGMICGMGMSNIDYKLFCDKLKIRAKKSQYKIY